MKAVEKGRAFSPTGMEVIMNSGVNFVMYNESRNTQQKDKR